MQVSQTVVLTLAALLMSGSVLAQERVRHRFSWVRGPGADSCPAEAALEQAVRERLGGEPFAEDAARSIEGFVRREGPRLVAELSTRDGAAVLGRRALESDELDCRALAEATVLAVALTIDPEAALGPPAASGPLPAPPAPREPVPTPAPAPEPSVVLVPVSPPAPPPEPKPPALAVDASAIVNVGALPRPALGAALTGRVEVARRFRLGVGLQFLPEVDTDDEQAAFGLTTGRAFGCWALVPAPPELDLCGGVEAGTIHSVVRAERPVDPGDKPWLAVTLGPELGVDLVGPLQLRLGGFVGVPLLAHEFVVRGAPGSVFSPSVLTGTGFLGLGLKNP